MLPGKTKVLLEDNGESELEIVDWDMEKLKPDEVGSYTIYGELESTNLVKNQKNLKAEVKVEVHPLGDTAEKLALANMINQAEVLLKNAVIGDKPGQYPKAAEKALKDAISEAKKVYQNENSTNGDFTKATEALEEEIQTFTDSMVPIPSQAKQNLATAIATAENRLNNAVAGDKRGQYPQAAIDALREAVQEARSVYEDEAVDDDAFTQAKQTLDVFEKSVVKGFGGNNSSSSPNGPSDPNRVVVVPGVPAVPEGGIPNEASPKPGEIMVQPGAVPEGVPVGPTGGTLLPDTKEYAIKPEDLYDIKVIFGGKDVTLRAYSSRDGIAELMQLPNGNFRIKGLREGTTYIMFDILDQNGVVVNHASVKVTIGANIQSGGSKEYQRKPVLKTNC